MFHEAYADGNENVLNTTDKRKVWQRLHTEIAKDPEAQEAWKDVSALPPGSGKESKKRAILNVWLKERTFGAAFWNVVSSITTKNSKNVELRWKTAKQLQDIFGDEADTMKEALPSRPHPQQPRITQWRLPEDYSTMAIEKGKSRSASGSQKLNSSQFEGLTDAIDNIKFDQNFIAELEKEFEHADNKMVLEALIKSAKG